MKYLDYRNKKDLSIFDYDLEPEAFMKLNELHRKYKPLVAKGSKAIKQLLEKRYECQPVF